jgi:hypothetical protein
LFADDPPAGPPRLPSDLTDEKPASDIVVVRPSDPDSFAHFGKQFAVSIGSLSFSGELSRDDWKLGPVARDANFRRKYAGTFDQEWVENRMPLLPVDFDVRYNLVAPPNQIVPGFLKGDEHIKLTDVYFGGKSPINLQLPGRAVVVSGNVTHHYFTEIAPLDTMLIWTEKPQLVLVWRLAIVPKQKVAEVCNLFVNTASLRSTRELYGVP